MKKISFTLILVLMLAGFFSCRPDVVEPIGEANNNVTAITGTWKLVKVTQTDADAAKKGFPYKVLDITTAFAYSDFRVTFNSSAGSPTTFTTTAGNSPKVIKLANGNWAADDIQAPKVITLTNGTTTEKLTLGAYPNGSNSSLKIRVERLDAATNKLLITYDYEFIK